MQQKLFTILVGGLTTITLLFLSCKKEETYMSSANIIGVDVKMCPCCGGTEIVIDKITYPNNSYFLIGQLPAGFSLGNNPTFPIAVKIDYKIDTAHCFGNYVKITRITRR